jgi:hypothetical protein
MAEHNVLYVFFAGSTLNWLIMEVFRPGNTEVSDGNVEICFGVCLCDDLLQSRFKIAML